MVSETAVNNFVLLLLAITLSACTSSGTYNRLPAPTVESSPTKDEPPRSSVEPPANPGVTQHSNPAILALLKQSRQSRASGNLPQAISHIERALRIEPRRADLWLELAGLHLEALNFQNAEQVARKSLSFAQESVTQAKSAWYIIATALEATGDRAQAARIRQYVKTL
jgi:tetratricopeptide (TPR) repeat protein